MEEKQAPVSLKPVSVQKVAAVLRKARFLFAERTNKGRTDGVGCHIHPSGVAVRFHGFHRHVPSLSEKAQKALTGAGIVFRCELEAIICTGIKEV